MKEKNCEECGKPFIPHEYNPHQKFCNKKCQKRSGNRAYRERKRQTPPMVEKHCEECGKMFIPNDKYHPHQKYCSKTCQKRCRDRRYYGRYPEKILNKHEGVAKKWRANNKLEGKCSRCKHKLPDGWEGLVCPDCRTTCQMTKQWV